MQYPTEQEVANTTDKATLVKWWRFLPSPGTSSIDKPDFMVTLERELNVLKQINEKLTHMGGITPEVSKQVGWD